MLTISPAVKIFLYADVADLRRGYDGLAAIIENAMEGDPLSGHIYMFLNRRRNRIKLLYWAVDGYAIWMKRLERGSFELVHSESAKTKRVEITASQLSLILEGIELSSVRRRKRYRLPKDEAAAKRSSQADFPERGRFRESHRGTKAETSGK